MSAFDILSFFLLSVIQTILDSKSLPFFELHIKTIFFQHTPICPEALVKAHITSCLEFPQSSQGSETMLTKLIPFKAQIYYLGLLFQLQIFACMCLLAIHLPLSQTL